MEWVLFIEISNLKTSFYSSVCLRYAILAGQRTVALLIYVNHTVGHRYTCLLR